MPDYLALKNALNTTYANMSDAEILSILNTANVELTIDVPTQSVINYLGVNGILPIVRGWVNNVPPLTFSSNVSQQTAATLAAQTFGLMIGPPPLWDALLMSNPTTNVQITGMVDILVEAGLIPSVHANNILNMSKSNTSQASIWGWENGIYENDILAARKI